MNGNAAIADRCFIAGQKFSENDRRPHLGQSIMAAWAK